MAGGMEGHGDAIDGDGFAITDRLRRAGEIIAVAQPHHVQRFLRRQYGAVAGAGMVGMGMRDQRPLDNSRRIDMKAAALAAQAGRGRHQDVFRTHLPLDKLCASFRKPPVVTMTETGPLFVSSGDLIADRRYQWALDLIARGDLAGAADLLAQTAELAPGFAAAWFMLGEAREKLGDRDRRGGGLHAGARGGPAGSARRRTSARTAWRRRGESRDVGGLRPSPVRPICRPL